LEGPVKGDVVVLPFPFSDLSKAKKRPALVLAALPGDDIILCQIASAETQDTDSVVLGETDFLEGRLSRTSHVRPNRIFTAARQIILYRAGHLKKAKIEEIVEATIRIIRS
jgi:mRNA interferase MazF